jgi:hypothetical protein
LSITNPGIPARTKIFPQMWLQFAKLRLRNIQADMTDFLPWRAYAPKIFALAALLSLGGCIDSFQPLLTGAQPLLGNRPHIEFYVLRDGAATEPMTETFAWRDSRYVPIHSTASDLHDFTLHAFAGADLIVQSLRAGHPVEYGVARKLADGTYLLFAVDEKDADAATRDKYCGNEPSAACRVATAEAVLAFARASAAKPRSSGGLAVLMADH